MNNEIKREAGYLYQDLMTSAEFGVVLEGDERSFKDLLKPYWELANKAASEANKGAIGLPPCDCCHWRRKLPLPSNAEEAKTDGFSEWWLKERGRNSANKVMVNVEDARIIWNAALQWKKAQKQPSNSASADELYAKFQAEWDDDNSFRQELTSVISQMLQNRTSQPISKTMQGLIPIGAEKQGIKQQEQSQVCDVCNECKWSNTGLLNVGIHGEPRWLCHGCISRLLDQAKQQEQQVCECGHGKDYHLPNASCVARCSCKSFRPRYEQADQREVTDSKSAMDLAKELYANQKFAISKFSGAEELVKWHLAKQQKGQPQSI